MLGGEEQTAWKPGLERLAHRLISGYAGRCAARAQAREERLAADRKEFLPDGIFAVVPDGTLAVARQGVAYFLWLEWDDGYGQRLLAQGELADVERTMAEVAVHGPAGGPEFRGQGTAWHRRGDQGTEHSLTLGGEFRLMRLFGGPHLLLFARNDGGACILGIGDAEELKRTAGARLRGFVGDALNIYVGDARLQLRAVGAVGVLGYLEMFDGTTMLLGHLSGTGFGLFQVRGGKADCVALFDLEALQQGDLGQVLRWTCGVREDARDGEDDKDDKDDLVDHADWQKRQRRPRSRAARPRRSRRVAHKARLSAEELSLITRHLTWSETPAGKARAGKAPEGKGSTVILALVAGIRGLARLGLPNQLLYGCDLLRLLKQELDIKIHCCSRTLSQALAAVARLTPMVVSVGRRWLLRFGDLLLADSELLREIARKTPKEPAGTTAVTTFVAATSTASTPGVAQTAIPDRLANTSASRPSDTGASAISSDEAASPADVSDGEYAQSQDGEADLVDDLDLQPLIQQEYRRRYKRWRQDGPLRTTLASVPEGESASRWEPRPKSRGRGPPW